MIILSAQDLEDYGVRQTASIITFMGKAFVRGQTYAQRLRDMAIATAEESMKRGSTCLLVDFDTHITLWREEKNPTSHQSQAHLRNLNAQSSSEATAPEDDAHMKHKEHPSSLKYRGNTPSTSLFAEGQALARLLSEHDITYRGQSANSSLHLSQLDASEAHDKVEEQPRLQEAKRRIKYRGRWVDID